MWRRAGAGGLLLAVLILLASAGAAMALQTRGGGIDGGLPDTTNGGDSDGSPVGSVPSTTPSTTGTTDVTPTTDTTLIAPTTAPAVTAPAAVAPPVTAPAQLPAAAADPAVGTAVPKATDGPASVSAVSPDEVVVAGDHGRGAGALRPASTRESPGFVRSPAMLLLGLGMVVAGTVALVVRSRRAPGGQYS